MISSLLTLLMFHQSPVLAANPDKPHSHQGTATKFVDPKRTELTAAEMEILRSGIPVRKQVKQGNGGRGIAIMDVSAPIDVVMNVILDFPMYPKWIDQLSKCEIYDKSSEGSQKYIYADFIISSMMMTVQYYIKHTYTPSKNLITWTLDYGKESDLDDSTGYWLAYPSPDDPKKTRVEYSVDLRVGGWVPGFVEDMLANQGLEDATKWMKRESEKRASK